jgi:zinc transport system substrate-binding protein
MFRLALFAVALTLSWAAVALALASAGVAAEPAAPAAKLTACVSILPQQTFVERVGGDHVKVTVLVGPGQSPHTFEPTPKQLAELAKARLFFAIGWPFERRLLEKATAANPGLTVIDSRQGVPLRHMTADEAGHDEDSRAGGSADENKAGDADPHIWLSPRLVKVQAATIARALEVADPAHAADYQRNLKAFQEDLDRTDAKISEALAPLKGKELFVYHPAFGYFADAYGLKQVPVEVEGKEPSARQLAAFVERAKARGVKVILVQPQFSAKSAEAVARAIGGAVVPMDDLAKDYLANLQRMAEDVRQALGASK